MMEKEGNNERDKEKKREKDEDEERIRERMRKAGREKEEPNNPALLTWRASFFARGDEYPSTLVSGLPRRRRKRGTGERSREKRRATGERERVHSLLIM
jgi:hypothetical protein